MLSFVMIRNNKFIKFLKKISTLIIAKIIRKKFSKRSMLLKFYYPRIFFSFLFFFRFALFDEWQTSGQQIRGDWFERYSCRRSPTPRLGGVTFYPRDRFFSGYEEIPEEFVDRFRGGFLHDASWCSWPFPTYFLKRTPVWN